MAQAAESLTGVTLELGGKSPSIVLPDVDVLDREMHLRWSRNGGQGRAVAARPLLVHESIYDEFLEVHLRVRPDDRRRSLGSGDQHRPDDPAGAPSSGARLHRRLAAGRRPEGAGGDEAAAGAGLVRQPGAARRPATDARAVQEEIFGPVAVLLRFRDTDDAVRLANDTPYGLAANIWSNDPVEARRIAERIRRHGLDQRRRRDAPGRAVRRLRPLRGRSRARRVGNARSSSPSTSSGGHPHPLAAGTGSRGAGRRGA